MMAVREVETELIDHATTELLAGLDQLATQYQFMYAISRFPEPLAKQLGKWRVVMQWGNLAYSTPYGETFKADTRKEALAAAIAWVLNAAANFEEEEEEDA